MYPPTHLISPYMKRCGVETLYGVYPPSPGFIGGSIGQAHPCEGMGYMSFDPVYDCAID
jgi:hypothetical protein